MIVAAGRRAAVRWRRVGRRRGVGVIVMGVRRLAASRQGARFVAGMPAATVAVEPEIGAIAIVDCVR